jgi:hypothetical protein
MKKRRGRKFAIIQSNIDKRGGVTEGGHTNLRQKNNGEKYRGDRRTDGRGETDAERVKQTKNR